MRLNSPCCFWYVLLACCWGKSLSIPQQLINEFKSTLLPLFGFKDRPKIDGAEVQVPEAVKKLYEMQNDYYLDTTSLPLPGLHTQSANTVRSFTHVESPVDGRFNHPHKFRLKFDVSSIPDTENLKAAEIQLHQTPQATQHIQRIVVQDIILRGVKKTFSKPLTRVIDSKLVDSRINGTVSLDALPAVRRWLEDPSTNHGLIIEIYTASKKRHNIRLKRDLTDSDWGSKQPLLLTYTDDGRNKQKSGQELSTLRRRRGTVKRGHRKHDNDPCRRRQMYVDFRDVGWNDWIVAPLGYDAFYCGGECDFPMPEHMNTTNHAIIQSIMNSARPVNVPKPCCVPTQLSSISMLYVDSQKQVILKNYREMVVTGCGCR